MALASAGPGGTCAAACSRPPDRRDPRNRRLHLVELTPGGDALCSRLREVAAAFDQRLRAGLTEHDVAQFESLLTRLHDNVT